MIATIFSIIVAYLAGGAQVAVILWALRRARFTMDEEDGRMDRVGVHKWRDLKI